MKLVVSRTIRYEGDEAWVRSTLAKSLKLGVFRVGKDCTITIEAQHEYPETSVEPEQESDRGGGRSFTDSDYLVAGEQSSSERPSRGGETDCNASAPTGLPFVCTRPKGHVGDHVAHDIMDNVVQRWSSVRSSSAEAAHGA